MHRIVLEPLFVLHTRPYSNTSLIAECFTRRFGRVAFMARSARGPKSRFGGKLQLFTPMLASWSGQRELKNLNQLELQGKPYQLEQQLLLCGFYLNELLMTLLRHDDPYLRLYEYYQDTLNAFEQGEPLEPTLRYFEKHLLDELGYGLSFCREAISGASIAATQQYRYLPGRGFLHSDVEDGEPGVFAGTTLLALHHENLIDERSLKEAKRLMRMVISEHLGGRTLHSRALLC